MQWMSIWPDAKYLAGISAGYPAAGLHSLMASNNVEPGKRLVKIAIHDAIMSKLSVTSSIKKDLEKAKHEKWKNRKSEKDKSSVMNLVTPEMAEIYKKIEEDVEIRKRNLRNRTSNSKMPLGRGRSKPSQNPVYVHRKERAQSLPSLDDRHADIVEEDESLASELAFNSLNWPVQFPKSQLQSRISSKSLATDENVGYISLNNSNNVDCEALPCKSQSNDNLLSKSSTILSFPEPICNFSNTFSGQNRPFSVTHADDIKCLLQSRNNSCTSSDVTDKKMVYFNLENEKCDADSQLEFASDNLLPRSGSRFPGSGISQPFKHEIKKSNSYNSKNITKPAISPPHYISSNLISSGLFRPDINQTYHPPITPDANFNYVNPSDCMQNYSPMVIGLPDKTPNTVDFLHVQSTPKEIYANNISTQDSSPVSLKYLHSFENTFPKVPYTVFNSSTYDHSNHPTSSELINPDSDRKELDDLIDSFINKNSDSKSNSLV